MTNYNNLMKKYENEYYCPKNTDGIHVLVNHAAWCELKGRPHDGAQVHIESYDKTGEKLLLTMTKGSIRLFNNRLKLTFKLSGEWEKSLADDGGYLVFDPKDLPKVAEAFQIKRKQQRKPLSEERKEQLRAQLARIKR